MSFWEEQGSRHLALVGRHCRPRGRGVACGHLLRHLDDTLFIPRVLDIYFENLYYMLGTPMEKDKASPRKLYVLIIATYRILPTGKLFFRSQTIEQLWSHLNPGGGTFDHQNSIYAHSTIL